MNLGSQSNELLLNNFDIYFQRLQTKPTYRITVILRIIITDMIE